MGQITPEKAVILIVKQVTELLILRIKSNCPQMTQMKTSRYPFLKFFEPVKNIKQSESGL